MQYRRNTDDRLRQAGRAYDATPGEGTLIAYNVERVRAGLPKLIATEKRMLDSLMDMVDVRFKPVDVQHAQFSVRSESNPPNQGDVKCWEIAARTLDLPVRPTNESIRWVKEQYKQMIPVITGLGWVVLYQQCAYGETTLSIIQLPNNEGWALVISEDGKISEEHYSSHSDAIDALMLLKSDVDIQRSYPALYVVQPYVFMREYTILAQTPIISIEHSEGANIRTSRLEQTKIDSIITVQTGFKQPSVDYELDDDHPTRNMTVMYALVKYDHPSYPNYVTYECSYYHPRGQLRGHLILLSTNSPVNQLPDLAAGKADLIKRMLMEHPPSYPYNRCKLQFFD